MKQRGVYTQGLIISGVFLLVLGFSPAAWAQPTGMLKLYGSAFNQGEYEGTLYCLRHDFSQDKKDQEICTKEGHHHHVLMMADGHVHPLYGDTEELNKQLNAADMNAQKVKIRGKYYPVSNAIMVTTVTPVKK